MRSFLVFILLSLCSNYSIAQTGFSFPSGVDKIEIPFQSVYNLIILPVQVNGVEMDFLLDTGANKSVIFNFNGIDSLNVRTGKVLKVSGYGAREPFEAYYSERNEININGYSDDDVSILITVDQEINLLPTLGVNVNGIMGADFFKNAVVDIDYENQQLRIYRSQKVISSLLRKFQKLELKLVDDKPYINGNVFNDDFRNKADILVDTGRSDALWLANMKNGFKFPEDSFDDFLGTGLNGKIYGKRSKIDGLVLSQFELERVTVSTPYDNYDSLDYNPKQQVSIGSEVLARFRIIFDYSSGHVYLKSNRDFENGFYYNMAGIEVKAGEKELFTLVQEKDNSEVYSTYGRVRGQKRINTSKQFSYKLLPKLYVDYVRPDSPADKAGIEIGSEILRINGIKKGNLTLDNTVSQFFKNPYSTLKIITKKGDKQRRFKLKLVPVIR